MLSSSWVYRVSCVLRVLCLFSPGYIHPDEFFQGGQVSSLVHDSDYVLVTRLWTWRNMLSPFSLYLQEVFASSILGLKEGLIPWEFQPQHALRCIVFP
jgi:hypothetical protein